MKLSAPLLFTCLFLSSPVFATSMAAPQPTLPDIVGPQLVSLESDPLVATLQSGSSGNVSFTNPKAIYEFYRDREFKSFWTNGSHASSRARDALNIMEQANDHGMNPENYAVSALKTMMDADEFPVTDFELIMTESVIRYGRDMTGIRIKPATIGADYGSWKPMGADNLLKFIDETGDVEDALHALEPHTELYDRLKSELKKTITAMGDGETSLLQGKKFPGIIRPHTSHAVIADIRKILNVKSSGDKTLYDDVLVEAVKNFQTANGLKNDGMVGERTFTALQRGPMQKLVQIIATMERIRWMPRKFNGDMPAKFVEVNIPRQELQLFENNAVVSTIPVIVGKPERPTQDFITRITGIRFNPSWHVPATIKSEDLLPMLQKNTGALAKKNLELIKYTSDGATKIDPKTIDWKQITPAQMKSFGMVQDPGDKNPLGRVRVLMPNPYDIYLHDTNTPELFSKDFRALSSGCVRVSDPKKLAAFILAGREGWSDENMTEILATTKTKEIPADEIPVYLIYQTIWLDGGTMIIGPDIYDKDVLLYNSLAAARKLPQSLQGFTVTK